MKKMTTYISILSIFVLISFYNNCAPEHIGSDIASSANFSDKEKFINCEKTEEKDLFQATYYPFLQTNCINCHTKTGEGKGSFSDDNAIDAWNSFALAGEPRIAEFSVNSGHNAPYTGSQHNSTINLLSNAWKDGQGYIAECKKQDSDSVEDQYKDKRIHLKSKSINPTIGSISTISWDLDTDLIRESGANLPPNFNYGANISINVEVEQTETSVFYKISNPEIVLGSDGIVVPDGADIPALLLKSLRLKINGQILPNVTTFMDINVAVPIGATKVLSAGGVVIDGEVRGSDVISITFGEIADTLISPIPDGPALSFKIVNVSIAEQDIEITNGVSTGAPVIATLTVQLDNPTDSPTYAGTIYQNKWIFVNFNIDEMASTAEPKCCTRINSKDFDTINIDRYDWDYELISSNTLVFQPGATEASIEILIARDSRPSDVNTVRYNKITQEYVNTANGNSVIANSEDFESIGPFESENGETIKVKLTSYSIGSVIQPLPTNDTATVTITDNDTVIPGVPFSALMEPGGIFRNECLKCHNPVDHRQGYSLTEFDSLIDRRIIVPGDPNDSKFYKRMDGDISIGLTPMPLDDFLAPVLVNVVRQWIDGGAPNN